MKVLSKVSGSMVMLLLLVVVAQFFISPASATLPASEASALAEILLQWPSLSQTNNWTQGDEAEACSWPANSGIWCIAGRDNEAVQGLYDTKF
jgi:hypothetical protein